MSDKQPKALVLAGFGINCDYETQYALEKAGFQTDRLHINRIIELSRQEKTLRQYHLLAVDGGFAWGDDHGAGVLLALKLRAGLGDELERFVSDGKLIIGICNGFQALVNMGLLPGFDGDYRSRLTALAANDCGNFRDQWVHLAKDPAANCVFTDGVDSLELPVRHGEGKFYAPPEVIERLRAEGQVVLRYGTPAAKKPERRYPPVMAKPEVVPAQGRFPDNPNGSLDDVAGIADPTGRIFGLMPHPEAFHHLTNHPDWTRTVDFRKRWSDQPLDWEGEGLQIFHNAARWVKDNLL